MADRPIIFSAPMVRALLDGRKTQTRLVVEVPGVMGGRYPILPPEDAIELEDGEFASGIFHYRSTGALSGPYDLPAAVGDRLWVQESFCAHWGTALGNRITQGFIGQSTGGFVDVAASSQPLSAFYEATDQAFPESEWGAAGDMPRWASRLTLVVEEVRVEPLQAMEGQHPLESDALAEGVYSIHHGDGEYYYNAFRDEPHPQNWCDPTDAFRELWNSLHTKPGERWQDNPDVVVLAFRVVRGNIDQVSA